MAEDVVQGNVFCGLANHMSQIGVLFLMMKLAITLLNHAYIAIATV
jgi:hypothetical protein